MGENKQARAGIAPVAPADGNDWRERWENAWKGIKANPPEGLLEKLLAAYREPWRGYHTRQHLRECLECLDTCRRLCQQADEVALALWFHDAVYEPKAQDNEAQSAAWACAALLRSGASSATAGRVRDLVLITRHRHPPETPDQQIIIDIDLAILGAPPARFDEYETQIRTEYRHVPSEDFRLARLKLLSGWLASPRIYHTRHFQERLQAAAHQNLRGGQCGGWNSKPDA